MSKRNQRERVTPTRFVERVEKRAQPQRREPEVYYVRGVRPPPNEYADFANTTYLPERPKA